MAYLDLDDMFAAPAVSAGAKPAKAARSDSFSALEWSVIALAKRDNLRSLGTPGRMSRAIASLFGMSTASELADPRLEALRRTAVYVWRRGFALPTAEVTRFVVAGFSQTQLETLVASVTGVRIGAREGELAA